jgi:hypothetical protein
MARQSKSQKQTTSRVMHEFKHGELRTRGTGPKVKSRRQAIAIALHESGSTNQESPRKNKQNLRKSKTKERSGNTGEARKEGKKAQTRTMKSATARKRPARVASRGSASKTKSVLYAEARRRNIPGRSKMSKDQLARALR